MWSSGKERLGGISPPQSSPTAAGDDVLPVIPSQAGISLSQQLLTHRPSSHHYLERQHITHAQHHQSQLEHLFPCDADKELREDSPGHPARRLKQFGAVEVAQMHTWLQVGQPLCSRQAVPPWAWTWGWSTYTPGGGQGQ